MKNIFYRVRDLEGTQRAPVSNVIHRSREFVEKHKQHHHIVLAVLALVIAGTGVYMYRNEIASAATFTWTQSSWAGGATANIATHTSNKLNWTEYTSTSSASITADANGVRLLQASYTSFDDGQAGTVVPSALAYHTATLLPDGRVLLTGGLTTAGGLLSTTYFGTISGNTITWVAGTALPATLERHTASVLSDGRILVTGGRINSTTYLATTYFGTISGNTITWVAGTAMPVVKADHTASILSDGRILVTGGRTATSVHVDTTYFGTISGNTITWASGTVIPIAKAYHTASILSDGRILLTGGYQGTAYATTPYFGTISGNTITWVAGTGMPAAKIRHTASVLSDGRILVTGGYAGSTYVATTYFGVVSGDVITWSAGTALQTALSSHTASTLPDGRILITGGLVGGTTYVSTTYFATAIGDALSWGGFESGTNATTTIIGTGSSASVGLGGFLANTWDTSLAQPPATIGAGGSLVAPRGAYADYLYALRGNSTNTLYRYQISTNTWYTMANAPGTIATGGLLAYPGSGDFLYTLKGSSGTLYAYSLSTDTWSTLAASVTFGESGLTGNGDFLYSFQGGSFQNLWRYQISTNTWLQMAANGSIGTGPGDALTYPGAGDYLYGFYGWNTTWFTRYSISLNNYTAMAVVPGTATVSTGAALAPAGSYIYAFPGKTTSTFYRYSTTTNAWATMTSAPATIAGGGALVYPGSGDVLYAFRGNSTNSFYRYAINNNTYSTSGTFTSAVIDMGAKSNFTTISVASTTSTGVTAITIDIRAGDSPTAPLWGSTDANWTSIGISGTTAGTVDISSLGAHRYIQYRANLSTQNVTITPTLDSVTINATQYALSGNLISSVYDSVDPTNVISKISWTSQGATGDEIIKFQVRSASTTTDLANATWCGPSTACTGADYFLEVNNGVDLATGHPLNTGANDRYLQYKAYLVSSGDLTPELKSVGVGYVVNSAPVVTNITATQGSNPADTANYGKVTFSFDTSDYDTASGTVPNIVTPTLYRYYDGASWATIPSGELDGGAYSQISITNNTSTTSKSVTWTPLTVIPRTGNAKIEVTVDDGEGANRFGVGTQSTTFVLDTTPPTVTSASFDSTQDLVSLTATDGSAMEYRLCNATCVSEAWLPITNNMATSTSWSPTGFGAGAETVYLQVRDLYGNINTTPTSIVAPATPSERFLAADVSNPSANTFGETLSWVAVSNATTYDVYYATTTSASVTPSTYTSLVSQAGNTFPHIISPSASSSAYWYKVRAVNVNGDISNYATISVGDVPDSFGTSLSDTTAPVITAIATSSVLSTSAVITITTDELASGRVYYGTGSSNGPSCDSYTASTPPSVLYSTSTVITLTGLTPSTTYFFCVKASDIAGNPTGNPPTGTDGGSFTTATGPTISSVTVQNLAGTSATIMWNTATSSDSYIYYSTSASLATSVSSGNPEMVTCTSGVCQHQVGLSGLTAATIYYFKVKSTDGDENSVTDTNSGSYYSFTTLADTTAPAIVGTIETPVKAPTAAVIVWQTDEPATSQANWGLASTTLTRFTVNDSTKSIYHVVTLSSGTFDTASVAQELTPETPYYFTVISADAANNTMTSSVQTFTTPATGNVTIVVVSSSNDTTDRTPPSISNVTVSDITPFSAVVKFSTDEDTVAGVDAGATQTYGQTASSFDWGKTQTIKLRGLTLGTEYHIRVKAVDKAGNTGTSADQTFKTTFLSENLKDMANVENIEQFQKEIENAIESILPSLVPPFVTKPIVSDITEGGAKVSFKSNIKAFPVVVFADEGTYDETKESPYTGEVSDTAEKATSHELLLTGLKGNTKYHIQARAFSLPKVLGKSVDVTFITKASKIAGSIVERKKDSFTVVWTTDQPTSTIVEYKDLKRGITGRKTDDAKKTSHSMKIENLPSGTAYEVNLSGLTEAGNIAEAGSPLSVTTSTDVTPPGISGFKVDNALVPGRTDRIQTIVSWVTDEPSNSTAFYQEGAGAPGDTEELANKNEILDSYVLSHSVILPSLKPGTIYRLKVTSSDDSGNEGSFGPRTVITPKQTESITDIIFKNFEDSFKFLRKI